jgi:hypothetical protein
MQAVTGLPSWSLHGAASALIDRVCMSLFLQAPCRFALERRFKMERVAGSAQLAARGMAILTGNQ